MFELAGWDPVGEVIWLSTATGHLQDAWPQLCTGLSRFVTLAIDLLRTDGAVVVRARFPA